MDKKQFIDVITCLLNTAISADSKEVSSYYHGMVDAYINFFFNKFKKF